MFLSFIALFIEKEQEHLLIASYIENKKRLRVSNFAVPKLEIAITIWKAIEVQYCSYYIGKINQLIVHQKLFRLLGAPILFSWTKMSCDQDDAKPRDFKVDK